MTSSALEAFGFEFDLEAFGFGISIASTKLRRASMLFRAFALRLSVGENATALTLDFTSLRRSIRDVLVAFGMTKDF